MTTTHVQQPSLFSYHKEIVPTRSDRQRAVLEALAKAPDMTNSELAQALECWPNQVTGRISELREAGLVVCRNPSCPNPAHLNAAMDAVHDACKRRCRVTGRDVFAWRVIGNSQRTN